MHGHLVRTGQKTVPNLPLPGSEPHAPLSPLNTRQLEGAAVEGVGVAHKQAVNTLGKQEVCYLPNVVCLVSSVYLFCLDKLGKLKKYISHAFLSNQRLV